MKVSSETVGPEKAAKWLASTNTANRPMNRIHVAALAASMSDGSWIDNGDTIVFASDGTLIDGQHRLSAIVQCGKPIQMIVVHGVEPSSFGTKDIGRRRSAADALGIGGVKNASATAAAIALLEWYDSGQPTGKSGRGVAPYKALELMAKYPGIDESVRCSLAFSELCRTSVVAAAHYLFTKANPEKSAAFFEGVRTGAKLELKDPQLTLRARLQKLRENGGLRRSGEIFGLFIKAWNAYVTGQKITTIPFVFGVDVFPTVKK